MAPIVAMGDCAWHVRGIRGTHLGPPHGDNGYVPAGYTFCGERMDVRWVPGEFAGGAFNPDKVCETCRRAWWEFYS